MTSEASIQKELDALLLPWGNVSTRRMFGGHGYFVGDRLFAVLHRGNVISKLPDAEREEVLSKGLARPFATVPGRPFGGWVEFTVEGVGAVESFLPWLKRAFEYVRVTPPKGRRTSKGSR